MVDDAPVNSPIPLRGGAQMRVLADSVGVADITRGSALVVQSYGDHAGTNLNNFGLEPARSAIDASLKARPLRAGEARLIRVPGYAEPIILVNTFDPTTSGAAERAVRIGMENAVAEARRVGIHRLVAPIFQGKSRVLDVDVAALAMQRGMRNASGRRGTVVDLELAIPDEAARGRVLTGLGASTSRAAPVRINDIHFSDDSYGRLNMRGDGFHNGDSVRIAYVEPGQRVRLGTRNVKTAHGAGAFLVEVTPANGGRVRYEMRDMQYVLRQLARRGDDGKPARFRALPGVEGGDYEVRQVRTRGNIMEVVRVADSKEFIPFRGTQARIERILVGRESIDDPRMPGGKRQRLVMAASAELGRVGNISVNPIRNSSNLQVAIDFQGSNASRQSIVALHRYLSAQGFDVRLVRSSTVRGLGAPERIVFQVDPANAEAMGRLRAIYQRFDTRFAAASLDGQHLADGEIRALYEPPTAVGRARIAAPNADVAPATAESMAAKARVQIELIGRQQAEAEGFRIIIDPAEGRRFPADMSADAIRNYLRSIGLDNPGEIRRITRGGRDQIVLEVGAEQAEGVRRLSTAISEAQGGTRAVMVQPEAYRALAASPDVSTRGATLTELARDTNLRVESMRQGGRDFLILEITPAEGKTFGNITQENILGRLFGNELSPDRVAVTGNDRTIRLAVPVEDGAAVARIYNSMNASRSGSATATDPAYARIVESTPRTGVQLSGSRLLMPDVQFGRVTERGFSATMSASAAEVLVRSPNFDAWAAERGIAGAEIVPSADRRTAEVRFRVAEGAEARAKYMAFLNEAVMSGRVQLTDLPEGVREQVRAQRLRDAGVLEPLSDRPVVRGAVPIFTRQTSYNIVDGNPNLPDEAGKIFLEIELPRGSRSSGQRAVVEELRARGIEGNVTIDETGNRPRVRVEITIENQRRIATLVHDAKAGGARIVESDAMRGRYGNLFGATAETNVLLGEHASYRLNSIAADSNPNRAVIVDINVPREQFDFNQVRDELKARGIDEFRVEWVTEEVDGVSRQRPRITITVGDDPVKMAQVDGLVREAHLNGAQLDEHLRITVNIDPHSAARDAHVERVRARGGHILLGDPNQNFYEVLGIERTASSADIPGKANEMIARIESPENTEMSAAEKRARVRVIRQAADVLTNEAARTAYDAGLAEGDHRRALRGLPDDFRSLRADARADSRFAADFEGGRLPADVDTSARVALNPAELPRSAPRGGALVGHLAGTAPSAVMGIYGLIAGAELYERDQQSGNEALAANSRLTRNALIGTVAIDGSAVAASVYLARSAPRPIAISASAASTTEAAVASTTVRAATTGTVRAGAIALEGAGVRAVANTGARTLVRGAGALALPITAGLWWLEDRNAELAMDGARRARNNGATVGGLAGVLAGIGTGAAIGAAGGTVVLPLVGTVGGAVVGGVVGFGVGIVGAFTGAAVAEANWADEYQEAFEVQRTRLLEPARRQLEEIYHAVHDEHRPLSEDLASDLGRAREMFERQKQSLEQIRGGTTNRRALEIINRSYAAVNANLERINAIVAENTANNRAREGASLGAGVAAPGATVNAADPAMVRGIQEQLTSVLGFNFGEAGGVMNDATYAAMQRAQAALVAAGIAFNWQRTGDAAADARSFAQEWNKLNERDPDGSKLAIAQAALQANAAQLDVSAISSGGAAPVTRNNEPRFMADYASRATQFATAPVGTEPGAPAPRAEARIVSIQCMLVAMGADIGTFGNGHDGVDGVWGPKTNTAFEQACRDLGFADPATVSANEFLARASANMMGVNEVDLRTVAAPDSTTGTSRITVSEASDVSLVRLSQLAAGSNVTLDTQASRDVVRVNLDGVELADENAIQDTDSDGVVDTIRLKNGTVFKIEHAETVAIERTGANHTRDVQVTSRLMVH